MLPVILLETPVQNDNALEKCLTGRVLGEPDTGGAVSMVNHDDAIRERTGSCIATGADTFTTGSTL